MEFTAWLAWLTLLVAFPVCVIASLLLRKKVLQAPHLGVLGERYRTAIYVTFVTLFFGLIFVHNDMEEPPLDLDTTKWITRLAILALSLFSAGGWIWLYRTTRHKAKS